MFNPGRNNPKFLHMSDEELFGYILESHGDAEAEEELDLRLNRS